MSDSGSVISAAKRLLENKLTKMIEFPAKTVFFQLHKKHFEILAGILISVKKGEKIEKKIEEMEKNIDELTKFSSNMIRIYEDIPKSPIDPAQGLFIILSFDYLQKDPRFVAMYNENLNLYTRLIQVSLDQVKYAVESARKIEQDGRLEVEKLSNEINASLGNLGSSDIKKIPKIGTVYKSMSSFDKILLLKYLERLQFIQLDIMTDVQHARSKLEDLYNRLNGYLLNAKRIHRF